VIITITVAMTITFTTIGQVGNQLGNIITRTVSTLINPSHLTTRPSHRALSHRHVTWLDVRQHDKSSTLRKHSITLHDGITTYHHNSII
jgi:hypothetical protein